MQTEQATPTQQQIDQQSLEILAAAGRGYLEKAQDDLGRNCVAPQLQGALNNLGALIARHYTPAETAVVGDTPADAAADPTAVAAIIDPTAPAANDDAAASA